MKNTIELKVPALSENEQFVRNAIASFALSLNTSLNEMTDLKTAVSEAFTNIVIHAYPGSEGYATIKATIEGNKIEVTIADEGVGIKDLEQAQKPFYTTKSEEERSGMGFTIMQTFTNEFEVKNKENGKGLIVRMLKEFNNGRTI